MARADEVGARALWLQVELPALALEVVTRAVPSRLDARAAEPVVVIDGQGARAEVVALSRAAVAAGISPGMVLEQAWALAGNLVVARRDLEAEGRALEETAAWAMQFSSTVTIRTPCGVGLEIGRSLGLYGGFERLRAIFLDGVAALGFSVRIGVAPSPAGARLLARYDAGDAALDYAELRVVLDGLPVALLAPELPRSHLEALRQLGLSTLGECWRLPRIALNRRVEEVVGFFDRVFGRRPDPQPPFQPPQSHCRELTLPAAVDDVQALSFGLNRLLLSLLGALQAQALGVMTLRLTLRYEADLPDVEVWLRMVGANRDAEHLLGLMRERLERVTLSGAVQAMEVRVTETEALGPTARDLFGPTGEDETMAVGALVERLRARLGEAAVRGLDTCADHRPERAWSSVLPGPARSASKSNRPHEGLRRPAWLLPVPLALEVVQGRPVCQGLLELLGHSERIEGGWWDGGDVSRDYYRARNPRGEQLWVFEDRRRPGTWYLHGVFA